MRITIINTDRNEKRYTRVELEEFVAQLSDGTYRQQYVCDFNKEICFCSGMGEAERRVESKKQQLSDTALAGKPARPEYR